MLKKIFCVLLVAQAACLFAQTPWTDFPEQNIPKTADAPRFIIPRHYRTVRLDLTQLQPVLAAAPERFTTAAAEQIVTLYLPMPDGARMQFRIAESPVMAPALQAKYPDIRCYSGTGISDPTATLKCDLTPQGFHAMIRSARYGVIFIDPYQKGDKDHYIVYNEKDFQTKKEPFICALDDVGPGHSDPAIGDAPELSGDCMFRRYRLALACTGEYAAFHGGTKALALAAMNTSVNRVNSVYERDLAISLQLVANNDLIVFTDPAADGYSNGNGSTMLGQNQTKCNTVIGSANYDIGHVFSTGGGGVAGLGVVCGNSVKARGVTGLTQPVGDPYDIDYVAHEMGHQFGANHTFNNTCNGNINGSTAFEPGSGTTIMAYAGVCSPNVQPHSDAYFHSISLQEIGTYVTAGQGNVCPVKINTGNTAPVVDAGGSYTIPKSTPFALTAIATDVDGDSLTYCWEQMDNQQAAAPPVSTSTGGPLFRSFDPSPSPTRYFPRLQDLVANVNPMWEELPGVARQMKFRVSVRDNFSGGGCTHEDNLTLTVAATAGPFLVTEPNTAVTWYVGETKTVTWDVANTDTAPVGCSLVRILLSTDGGFTYPLVLADSVPNSGSAPVEVPNAISATCRVMVQSVGNVFFDISNQNFNIEEPPAPTFLLGISTNKVQVCVGEPLLFTTSITGIGGFADSVQLILSGEPAGANVQISTNPVLPDSIAEIQLTGLDVPGVYTLTVEGTSDTLVRTKTVQLTVLDGAPAAPALTTPADGAVNAQLDQQLSWAAIPGTLTYQVQIATNPAFNPGDIVLDAIVNDPSVASAGLDTATVYYWRVMAINSCGESAFSQTYAFQTGAPACGFVYASTNVPVDISDTDVVTVTSTLDIPTNRYIADLNLSVQVNHTWVGDLTASLTAPWGDAALLFDQPGFPATGSGCNGDNLNLTLDDEAVQSADALENTCGNLPAISGAYQPIDLLNRFDNKSAQGAWTLEMGDNFPEDGGAITAWSLSLCFYDTVPAAELLINNPLTVTMGGAGDITPAFLLLNIASTNSADGIYILLSVPQHGTLTINGAAASIGSTFTQEDIIAGLVTYTNNGDAAATDSFQFDAVDASSNGWIHNQTFQINILQNNLAVTAVISQPVQCAGETNGQITVDVSGGTAPFQYSLNGGAQQFLNTFDNLAAGMYTVVVTDQNGFTIESDTVVLDDPTAVEALTMVTDDDLTAGATGGTGPYEYSLDGQNFQSGFLFENLPNGDYTLTVRDANGCTATATATVAVPPISATLEITAEIACAGDANGALVISANGGVPPYTYSLDGVNFQPENTFDGLAAGTYTVVVQDDSGNTTTSGSIDLNDPPALQIATSVANDDLTVDATGGTGALEYSVDGQMFQAGNFFENLPNGFYTVTVRDANGCTATAEAVISVDQLLASLKTTQNNTCAGGMAGVISVTPAGGVPPYTYSLNGVDFQPENTFSGLPAGSYSVVVKDDSGNTATSNAVTLTDPPAIVVAVDVMLNTLTVTASGGTGALSYSLDGQTFQPGNTFGNLPNGDYTVTVRDGNGCTATVPAIIDVPALQVLNIVVIAETPCAGAAIAIAVTAGGGVPPYEYSLDGSAYQPDSVFQQVSPGTHMVSVRDAAGTVVDGPPFTVVQPDPLTAAVMVLANDATVQAAGGEPPYSYSLNGGPAQASNQFPDLPNGMYEVVVTDANGCSVTETFEVNYVALGYIVTTTDPGCAGASDGSVDIAVSGGTPPYSFDGNLSSLPAGQYTIVVEDAVGDTVHVVFTLFDPPLLEAAASASTDTITVVATGGAGGYEYSLDGITYQASPVFPGLANGTYTVWVRDANGCVTTVENIVVDVVGVNDLVREWGLTVHPNPSAGLFRLTIRQAPAGVLRANVFDMAGRRLQEQVFDLPGGANITQTIDLTTLPAGVYGLRLTNGVQVAALRLIVQ